MENTKHLISIIIPIYNTSEYLPRCIDSVISQTYENLEILLINDGSTDGCKKICDGYAKKDNRVSVIHKKNTGQSDSQNIALGIAKGEFVAFVDSDDFMLPTMLDVLMQKIQTHNADIGICSYSRIDKPTTRSTGEDIILTGVEAMGDVLISGGKVNPETWSKLYKKSLFIENNILFPKGHTAGDQHTTYKLMFFAKKVVITKQALFRYMFRANSITGVTFNRERLYVLNAGDAAIDFVKNKNLPLENHALCFKLGLNLYLINQILKDNSRTKWLQTLNNLRATTLNCYTRDARKLLAKQRFIGVALLRMGWWAYIPVRNFINKFRRR